MTERGESRRRSVSGYRAAIALTAICLLSPAAVRAESNARYALADLEALQNTFVSLADTVRPSVVSIRCYTVRDRTNGTDSLVRIPISQGSGFVLDAGGYIGTNRHVIEEADVISVVLHDGMRYDAELIQADVRSDLAVLKIDADGLIPVVYGDLSQVRPNQWTFAYGNPFGMAYDNLGRSSVTYGVVSALGRQLTHRLTGNNLVHYYGNLIETSATINPGNSGGPLFNIRGEMIGVVTAIETSSGVNEGHGFAIPIDPNIRRVLDTLKSGQVVRYGFLGVQVADLNPPAARQVVEMGRGRGALISGISPPDGPAARAGLKADDIVIALNGVPVENSDHLVRLVQFATVDEEVEITYLRRQVKRVARAVLADRNELLGLASSRSAPQE